MDFTTPVDLPSTDLRIEHRQRLFLLGSCFADHVGKRLQNDRFRCLVNPFGTLYNPASIAAQLLRLVSENEYEPNSREVMYDGQTGQWYSWMHHSTFHHQDGQQLTDQLNLTMHASSEWLRHTDVVLVTFGTSVVYRLKETGMLVANCHKQPDRLFVRERLSAYDIVDTWVQVIQILRSVNPGVRFVITVSPIRHKRDGMHANQLSKAELLLAADALCQKMPDIVTYFPAYEIMMDELRDYRFYDEDMIHPSRLAVDVIYQRFEQMFISPEEQRLSQLCRQISSAIEHRPFDAEGEAYRQFIEKTLHKIKDIQLKHPYLDFEADISLCNTRLKR